MIGILYQQTPGTINHVITFNQDGQNTVGWGIFLEGGSSDPLVTVENSSQYDFSQGAIWAIGTTDAPNLRVAIENNVVSSASEQTYDIVVEEGTKATVSDNVVNGGLFGVYILAAEGSVSGNTILGSEIGIDLGVDGSIGEIKQNLRRHTCRDQYRRPARFGSPEQHNQHGDESQPRGRNGNRSRLQQN